jgi:hypothetical protein
LFVAGRANGIASGTDSPLMDSSASRLYVYNIRPYRFSAHSSRKVCGQKLGQFSALRSSGRPGNYVSKETRPAQAPDGARRRNAPSSGGCEDCAALYAEGAPAVPPFYACLLLCGTVDTLRHRRPHPRENFDGVMHVQQVFCLAPVAAAARGETAFAKNWEPGRLWQ